MIWEELARLGGRRGDPQDRIDSLENSALMFGAAAWAQARREGHTQAQAHVARERRRLAGKWEGRFSRILNMRDNRDWIDYCRSLGTHRGLPLP